MTKKTQQPAPDTANPQPAGILDPDSELYKRAAKELGFDNPVYYCRVVGNRLEFHLVGAPVVTWQIPRRL